MEGTKQHERKFGRRRSSRRNELFKIESYWQEVLQELTSHVFTQDKMGDKKMLRTREGGGFFKSSTWMFHTAFVSAFVGILGDSFWAYDRN